MAIEPVSIRVKRPWPGTRKGQELRTHRLRAARLVAAGLAEMLEDSTPPVNPRPRKKPRRATPPGSGTSGALFDTEE